MKRILWLVIVILLLIPHSIAFSNSQTQEILSSFPNSGFETNPTDPNNGWTWSSNDWVWDGSMAHSGTHSARISRSGGSESASIYSARVAVNPSTIYTLTYWIRTQNATYWPSVMLYQYTSGKAQTGPWLLAYANIGSSTNDWTVVNYRFQTMPDATQLQLRLYLYTSTTGTFWFDDFSLNQGTPAVFPYQTGFPVKASGWVGTSSPSVADINNDGNNELLIGAGSAINGWDKTGNKLPGFPLPTDDDWIIAQIALADLNQDGRIEIVAGTKTPNPPEGQCRVFAWQDNGTLLAGWPKTVAWETQNSNISCWITSVVLADINGDNLQEILASTTNNASGDPDANVTPLNLYAWNANGTLVSGNWPNGHTTAGFYGAIAAGDINGDHKAEILVARDHHFLNAYSGTGNPISGWPVETYLNGSQGNYQTDLRIVHGLSAPVLADLDGNGTMEYIVLGNVDGPGSSTTMLYNALLVLDPDGTRRPGWEIPALSDNLLTQFDQPLKAPAIADLNRDGKLEIIATTMDGWIRAYDLNKTVLWAFNFTQGAPLLATEPVIGDIDGDGGLEIVFGTHIPMQGGGNWDGPVGLWSLEADGTLSSGFPLPIPTPGMEAAPTLADMDGDGKLEILAATMEGRIYIWDTATTYNPDRLPWPTGRHDLLRSGSYTALNYFENSYISGTPHSVDEGDTTTFSIHVSSTTHINETISLTDSIPAGIAYIPGTLTATSGVATENGGVIRWNGTLPDSLTVDITYLVSVETNTPQVINNTVIIDTAINGLLTRTDYLYANFISVFLPVLRR